MKGNGTYGKPLPASFQKKLDKPKPDKPLQDNQIKKTTRQTNNFEQETPSSI
jgi:hypothetical protein